MAASKLTELEAVNILLGTISEAPVNTLSGESVMEVSQARAVLREISHAVQSVGWWFNTEKDYPLLPNDAGQIVLADNMVDVDVDYAVFQNLDLVERAGKLYDRIGHTFTISRSLKATVTFLLEFEELPEQARRHIAIRAARVLQARNVGSETLEGFTQRDEFVSLANLKDKDAANADFSAMNSPAIQRVTRRQVYGAR